MDPLEFQELVNKLLPLTPEQLKRRLAYQLAHPPEITQEADPEILERIRAGAEPDLIRVMDTGTTALQRQDLDPTLYALFVKQFPWWERISKPPSNGLVHAYNQITSVGTLDQSQITIDELGTVNDDTAEYARKTTNIAVFAQRRGISLKQQLAVRQGGAPYNPEATELAAGMTSMAQALQYELFQGNESGSSGDNSTTIEAGKYNAKGFDGLRRILGSVGTPNSGNNSVIVDQGNMTITQAIDTVAMTAADNGGMPTAVLLSYKSKMAFELEQNPLVRFNDPKAMIIPGVQADTVKTTVGDLPLIPIPGNSIGHYARTSDSVDVEDIYVVSEPMIDAPYLGSDTFTTLEIPIGANGQLSRLFIIFGMFGLAVKAPLFNGKVRRPTGN